MIRGISAARTAAATLAALDPDELMIADERVTEFETVIRRQLELIGEDPNREGLLKTPSRVAKSMAWLTRGYELNAKEVIGDALFAEAHENMVMVRDIEMYSMCEHHMLPFWGQAVIGYVPDWIDGPVRADVARRRLGGPVDGVLRDLGDQAYLLSPEDLEASALVPQLGV